jgi:hypothetical protein
LGACVAALVVVAVLGARSASAPRTDELVAFEAAIHDPIQHWGKIEVLGMRPAMFDLRRGSGVPAAAIAEEARQWQEGMREIGRQLAAAHAPASESQVVPLFTRALAGYVNAAALVERAAGSDAGSARNALLDEAISSAQHGDCVYDDASMAIQHARLQAGLGTTIDFPDHACAGR